MVMRSLSFLLSTLPILIVSIWIINLYTICLSVIPEKGEVFLDIEAKFGDVYKIGLLVIDTGIVLKEDWF